MNYVPNTAADQDKMLAEIGVRSLDELFHAVPEKYRFPQLSLPESVTEMEVTWEMQNLADSNADTNHYSCFLGAGAYNHYVPALVDHIIRRGEFFTAYTPYQPEVSQGTLQAIFEFQSMIGNLTGMDICTASHYDGATAFAEAALMACATTRRNKLVVSPRVHPQYRQTLRTYNQFNQAIQVVGDEDWSKSLADLSALLDDQTACLCISNPNFLGELERVEGLAELVHQHGAMLVVNVNPISLGLISPPADYGADIVIGEGQPLGIPLGMGGPYLGFFCTTRDYMRRIPGRIVGETVDQQGERGYVLTLKTREQDIRREKATSNICTNQGLMALAACVYMSVMGKTGLQQAAHLSFQKAHYAAEQVSHLPGYHVWNSGTFFNEFVVQCPVPVKAVNTYLLEMHDIIGGYDLRQDYTALSNHMLLCCTETTTRDDIDELVVALSQIS